MSKTDLLELSHLLEAFSEHLLEKEHYCRGLEETNSVERTSRIVESEIGRHILNHEWLNEL